MSLVIGKFFNREVYSKADESKPVKMTDEEVDINNEYWRVYRIKNRIYPILDKIRYGKIDKNDVTENMFSLKEDWEYFLSIKSELNNLKMKKTHFIPVRKDGEIIAKILQVVEGTPLYYKLLVNGKLPLYIIE